MRTIKYFKIQKYKMEDKTMIEQSILEEVLGVALSTGGDFAEIYADL